MMITRFRFLFIAFPLFGLNLTGCATQETKKATPESALLEARQAVVAALSQCTQRYGYDPKNDAGLGEHALAPTELQWRQCAYDAVRVYEKSNPKLAGRYEQLIIEDIQLTLAIQQGILTRSERRARIDPLIADVKAAEEAEIKKLAADRVLHSQQVMQILYGFNGVKRY